MAHTFNCPEGHTFESGSSFRAHCPEHPDKICKRSVTTATAEPPKSGEGTGGPPVPDPTTKESSTTATPPPEPRQRVIRVNPKGADSQKETRKRVPIRKSSRTSTSNSSTQKGTRSGESQQSGPRGSGVPLKRKSTSTAGKSSRRAPLVTKQHSTENAGAGSQVKEKRSNRFDSYVDMGFGGFGRRG